MKFTDADQCVTLPTRTALGLVLTSVYSSGMGPLNSKNVLSMSVRTAFQDAILFFSKWPTRKRDDAVMGMCDFAVLFVAPYICRKVGCCHCKFQIAC